MDFHETIQVKLRRLKDDLFNAQMQLHQQRVAAHLASLEHDLVIEVRMLKRTMETS